MLLLGFGPVSLFLTKLPAWTLDLVSCLLCSELVVDFLISASSAQCLQDGTLLVRISVVLGSPLLCPW